MNLKNNHALVNDLGLFTGKYYPQFGFKEVRREPWNPQRKPEGWLEKDGTTDVIFMELPKRGSK